METKTKETQVHENIVKEKAKEQLKEIEERKVYLLDKETNLMKREKGLSEGLQRIKESEVHHKIIQDTNEGLLVEIDEFKSVINDLKEVNLMLSKKQDQKKPKQSNLECKLCGKKFESETLLHE